MRWNGRTKCRPPRPWRPPSGSSQRPLPVKMPQNPEDWRIWALWSKCGKKEKLKVTTMVSDCTKLCFGMFVFRYFIRWTAYSLLSKGWVVKVRARTHTCDVRSHVCVRMCACEIHSEKCAGCVCVWLVFGRAMCHRTFAHFLEQNCLKMLLFVLKSNVLSMVVSMDFT